MDVLFWIGCVLIAAGLVVLRLLMSEVGRRMLAAMEREQTLWREIKRGN